MSLGRKPALAIVGSHSATRELAPYDDPRFEIWLFNEAAQKTEVYRRWDALLQLHKPEVYSSAENWVNKDHWQWLQQDHGDGLHGRKRIFMIDVDPHVPNSVKYPLEDVLSLVPYRYLRSSPAEALALAIHLGYKEIWLYGSELSSNTEYAYQAINYAFWIGFAHGRGIDLHLECWQSEFNQPLYGYEGETQIEKRFFEERSAEYEKAWKHNEYVVSKLQDNMENAMLKAKFDRVGELSLNVEHAAMKSGESYGIMSEARRYLARTDMISRQEFERVSAKAQLDGEKLHQDVFHCGGKCEYVWNIWRQTGRLEALNQLRTFLKEKTKLAYDAGIQLGVFRENLMYMDEYDKRVTALGGQRAVRQVTAQAAVLQQVSGKPDTMPLREAG